MGYNTDFSGTLDFTEELTEEEELKLLNMLGEDCRDHPEWDTLGTVLTYIDLELTCNLSGLEWSGAEKTYNLTEKVNLIIREMKKDFPNFELVGTLYAQGEEPEDRWKLIIGSDGFASEKQLTIIDKDFVCPHCGKAIEL